MCNLRRKKNQPFGGLERCRNYTLIRNGHDTEIIFSFLCQSGLGSPCVLWPQTLQAVIVMKKVNKSKNTVPARFSLKLNDCKTFTVKAGLCPEALDRMKSGLSYLHWDCTWFENILFQYYSPGRSGSLKVCPGHALFNCLKCSSASCHWFLNSLGSNHLTRAFDKTSTGLVHLRICFRIGTGIIAGTYWSSCPLKSLMKNFLLQHSLVISVDHIVSSYFHYLFRNT